MSLPPDRHYKYIYFYKEMLWNIYIFLLGNILRTKKKQGLNELSWNENDILIIMNDT